MAVDRLTIYADRGGSMTSNPVTELLTFLVLHPGLVGQIDCLIGSVITLPLPPWRPRRLILPLCESDPHDMGKEEGTR
jgi:hypothetical protein